MSDYGGAKQSQLLTCAARDVYRLTLFEMAFIVFSAGFVLDEFATSKEHGFTGSLRDSERHPSDWLTLLSLCCQCEDGVHYTRWPLTFVQTWNAIDMTYVSSSRSLAA